MVDRPQYPQPPWQLAVPVIAGVLAFTGGIEGQKQFWPLLQREYLTTYALLSVAHASETSALINVNGELATLETSGVLHHEKRPIENGAQFRSWLEANIYEGQNVAVSVATRAGRAARLYPADDMGDKVYSKCR
jgi:hypothetical protein